MNNYYKEQFAFSFIDNKDIITTTPSKRALGIDNIPIRVVKDCLIAILPTVTSVINSSFVSSTLPYGLEIFEVIHILIDGDHE